MITRSEYVAGAVTHREYYGDVVSRCGNLQIPAGVTVEQIKRALSKGDEHLSTIPLHIWDKAARAQAPLMSRAITASQGYGPSLSDLVCVLKEHARRLAESET